MNSKPDFLIVGAAKSGTTSLFHYLNSHPDIYIPDIKECRFFSQMPTNQKGLGGEKFQNEGIREWNEYQNLFKGYENKICGDISNDYLYHYEKSIKNIKKYLGNEVRIIIILRNPIDRAYSNYLHHIRDGWEDCSFEEALIKETWRIKNGWAWPYHYVKAGMYYKQVKAYMDNFESIKVYLFEDLKKDEFYKDLFAFLGVNYINVSKNKVYNVSGVPKNKFLQKFIKEQNIIKKLLKPFIPLNLRKKLIKNIELKNLQKLPMRIETREYLKEVFKEDISKLAKLIDRDLSHWLK